MTKKRIESTAKVAKKTSLSIKIEGVKLKKNVKAIVDLLFQKENVKALNLYRETTGKTLTESTTILSKFWYEDMPEYIKKDMSIVQNFIPDKCCVNCIGRCGRLKEKLAESVYDVSRNEFIGSDCNLFDNEESLAKKTKYVLHIVHIGTGQIRFRYSIDDNLLQIEHGKNGRLSNRKRKFIINDKKPLVKHIMKMLSSGFRTTSDSVLSETLVLAGIPVKKEKTYKEYLENVQSVLRKENMERRIRIDKMSDSERIDKIKEVMRESGMLDIVKDAYNNVIEDFFYDYYPEMSIKEIYEQVVGI